MFVSFSDIELEFVLSSMLIPKRFSFFFQLTIMLNLGNWSFFVRFFSLVGIASMLQHNFLVTLLFSPNFASHVWAIKSVDFRLAQLGACWFFPLQCFPPGWASPARFSLPDDSLCYSAAAAFAKFSANRSPNLWMPINLIDFHHTFSSACQMICTICFMNVRLQNQENVLCASNFPRVKKVSNWWLLGRKRKSEEDKRPLGCLVHAGPPNTMSLHLGSTSQNQRGLFLSVK